MGGICVEMERRRLTSPEYGTAAGLDEKKWEENKAVTPRENKECSEDWKDEPLEVSGP